MNSIGLSHSYIVVRSQANKAAGCSRFITTRRGRKNTDGFDGLLKVGLIKMISHIPIKRR